MKASGTRNRANLEDAPAAEAPETPMDGRLNEDNKLSEELDSSNIEDIDSQYEETSPSGSSSGDDVEGDSDEDEEDAENHATPPTSSPSATLKLPASPTALKSRLMSFLPQIRQANAELETDPDISTKRIDDVAGDEEQYIEMNLGLGVLKAKKTSQDTKDVRTTASEDSESSNEDSASASDDEAETGTSEVGIVDKLKRVRPPKRKIEEVI